MKNKILIGFLAIILCIVLTGCGNTEEKPTEEGNKSIENQVNLAIDKDVYEKESRIEVTLDFTKLNKDSAVIVIVDSTIEHDDEAIIHDNYEEYRYLSDFTELPFYMWAPEKEGKFDVRVYANNDGGKELAFVSFEVKN